MADSAARQYTFKSSLVSAGVQLGALTADEIRDLIAAVSAHIEVLTGGQVFNPIVSTTMGWEGRGRRIAYDPQLRHLAWIDSVSINSALVDPRGNIVDTYGGDERPSILGSWGSLALDVSQWVAKDWYIERVGADFPWGPQGVIVVSGALGWLDLGARTTSLTTALAVELLSNAVEAVVDSTVGFEIRDTVLIGAGLYVTITSIDAGANKLKFDSVGTLSATLPIDTTVRTWGKVPISIQRLANYLFAQFASEITSLQAGQGGIDPGRIRKEQTDRYSYELFASSDSVGGWVTGSSVHDMTLRRYARPAVAIPI